MDLSYYKDIKYQLAEVIKCTYEVCMVECALEVLRVV